MKIQTQEKPKNHQSSSRTQGVTQSDPREVGPSSPIAAPWDLGKTLPPSPAPSALNPPNLWGRASSHHPTPLWDNSQGFLSSVLFLPLQPPELHGIGLSHLQIPRVSLKSFPKGFQGLTRSSHLLLLLFVLFLFLPSLNPVASGSGIWPHAGLGNLGMIWECQGWFGTPGMIWDSGSDFWNPGKASGAATRASNSPSPNILPAPIHEDLGPCDNSGHGFFASSGFIPRFSPGAD